MFDFIMGCVLGLMLGLRAPGIYRDWARAKYGQNCEWCGNEITDRMRIDTPFGLRRAYFDDSACCLAWMRAQREERA